MRVKTITIGGFIARWFDDDKGWDWHGDTIPIPFYGALVIFYGKQEQDKVDHELLGHVPQVKRFQEQRGQLLGSVMYLVIFTWQYLRYGYEKAPLEAEALKIAPIGRVKP